MSVKDSLSEGRTENLIKVISLQTCVNQADLITINVSGMIYQTLKSTLERFPSSLLGNENLRKPYLINTTTTYFFDRNRQSFEAILYYYQSDGLLIRPSSVPMPLFAAEVTYFGLGNEEAFLNLKKSEGYMSEEEKAEKVLPKNRWQRLIWNLFEYPDSSNPARVLALCSLLVIFLSIVVFVMETMPRFHKAEKRSANDTSGHKSGDLTKAQPWFSLELGCIIWFTTELGIRFLASPSKFKFCMSILNIIDLLAVLPYFLTVGVNTEILRIIRVVRVFRIFKLSRHSTGLQILGETMMSSVSELLMLIFFLLLGMILFSTGVYYAEVGHNPMFTSIPDAFWYSLVTMTTVGYGDKSPITLVGKLVGSVCAVSGVLTIALPVPVIAANFAVFYANERFNITYRKSKQNGSLLGNVRPQEDASTNGVQSINS